MVFTSPVTPLPGLRSSLPLSILIDSAAGARKSHHCPALAAGGSSKLTSSLDGSSALT